MEFVVFQKIKNIFLYIIKQRAAANMVYKYCGSPFDNKGY